MGDVGHSWGTFQSMNRLIETIRTALDLTWLELSSLPLCVHAGRLLTHGHLDL